MKETVYFTIVSISVILVVWAVSDMRHKHETAMIEPVPELSDFWDSYESSGLFK